MRRLTWRTGWAFACTEHGTYLIDACAGCATPFGTGPGHGLLRGGATKVPVDGCRACGRALGTYGPATGGVGPGVAAPAALDAQRQLDALFAPPGATTDAGPVSQGTEVGPAQYLRDLRLLAVILDASRAVPDDLPPALAAALTERADVHAALDRDLDPGRAAPRARSAPPATAVHGAAVLTAAMRALALAPADADALLAPVIDGARRHEPLLLNRARWTFGGSTALQALLRNPGRNTFTSSALLSGVQRTGPTRPALDPRTVPAFLPAADYATRFGGLHPEPTVRRAVPILAVRLLSGSSVQEAADLLGVQHGSAYMAQTRLARAVRGPGEAYRLREAVAALVDEWAAATDERPDLRHRREALADWQIDPETWQALVEPLRVRETRKGGRHADWAGLRLPGSILVWEIVTGGEASQAPLAGVGTAAQARLLRKGASGLRPLLDAHAAHVALKINEVAAIRTPAAT